MTDYGKGIVYYYGKSKLKLKPFTKDYKSHTKETITNATTQNTNQ
jgi:hypothetical protein